MLENILVKYTGDWFQLQLSLNAVLFSGVPLDYLGSYRLLRMADH